MAVEHQQASDHRAALGAQAQQVQPRSRLPEVERSHMLARCERSERHAADATTARMIAGRLFPHPHQAAMRQRVIDVVGSSPVEPYLRSARALADWCAAERCAGFATPMLMLAGEHDYTPLAEKRAWAQRLGAQIAVVAGSRHGTPFDAIAATTSALLAFLTGQPVPATLAVDTPQTTPKAPPVLPAEVLE